MPDQDTSCSGVQGLLARTDMGRGVGVRLAHLDGDTDCVNVYFVKALRIALDRRVTLLPYIIDNRLHLQKEALSCQDPGPSLSYRAGQCRFQASKHDYSSIGQSQPVLLLLLRALSSKIIS